MWVVEYSLPSHLGVWSATPKTKVGEKKMHKSKFCIDCSRFAWLHATKEGKRKQLTNHTCLQILVFLPRVNAVIGMWRCLINLAKVKKRHAPYKREGRE
jgi:hypothetical protein